MTQQTSPYFFINKAALVLEWRIEDFCKWTAENISSPKNYEVMPSRIIHWLTAERRMEKEKKEGNIYYHFLWARHHDECFIHLSVPSQSFLQWWKCSISSDLILTTTLDKNESSEKWNCHPESPARSWDSNPGLFPMASISIRMVWLADLIPQWHCLLLMYYICVANHTTCISYTLLHPVKQVFLSPVSRWADWDWVVA